MGAWDGDWAARIDDFARREGCPHIWDYLCRHPGVQLTTVADTIGDAAAIQIQQLLVKHCVGDGKMRELIRDLMARSIRAELPKGWGTGNDFKHVQATLVGGLPEPYAALACEMAAVLLKKDPPSKGWLPESGNDEVLRRAQDDALASFPEERRKTVERGEIEPQPGDAYRARIEPIWKAISIYDGAEAFLEQLECVQPQIGDLFAAHWCQSEVCNGGFHQFFLNPTGVLAPEAAAGFQAMGMPGCAAIIGEAMRLFDSPYPREQEDREAALESADFRGLDERFYALLETEAGGFAAAADRYSGAIHGSPWRVR